MSDFTGPVLAQAGNEEAQTITSEPLGQEGQTSTVVSDANQPARQAAPKSPLIQMLPIVLIFLVMYLLMFRGPKKKQQQHKQMVQSLKKNDRVQTVGGIIGTVVEVRNDEIILKVDESNNTKLRISPSAIGKNLSSDAG